MSKSYDLKALLSELDKLREDYESAYERPIAEMSVLGLMPDPEKGSGLSKFQRTKLRKVLNQAGPLDVSDNLREFTGSILSKVDDNNDYLKDWLSYIDEYEVPQDKSYLEWRGLKGAALKDISNKFSNAAKTEAVLDTAYGNHLVLSDLYDEAKTTSDGGLASAFKRAPSYLLSSLIFGLLGGGIGTVWGEKGIPYGAATGSALGALLNYIRRKNKYGGAVNV